MIRKIERIIEEVIKSETLRQAQGKFLVMASDKPEFGHYSTNAAFIVGEDPAMLAGKIQKAGGNLFEKVEVKSRFINFWISKKALVEELSGFLKNPVPYTLYPIPLKINLEFVSANPTGPLTMANGRGGFLGDVLANVLEAVGHKVTREYYINDAGNQVRLLGESVLAALGKAEAKEEHYKGDYVKELAKKLEKVILRQAQEIDSEEIGRMAAAELLSQIKKSVKNVGVKFDVWFSEYEELRSSSRTNAEKKTRTGAEAIKQGSEVEKILKILEQKNLVEKKEGAVWLKTSDIADEKDRVLVKSDGLPTYFLADLAYHYDKFVKRKFDQAIDIWGADHHGYVARLKAGIKALGIDPEKLKIIITQLVRLIEDGKEVRMSKRKGEFITLDELIAEVGNDAARFFFLTHAPDTHMDFDLALAKERSMKNPVYYVQYAYVRCSSILRKVKSKRIKNYELGIKKLESESELNLIRELVKLPDVILQTAEDYQVSRLTRYAMELARAVHNFYEKERVIDENGKVSEPRLALVLATREILARLFKILGIDAPEKM